MKKISGRQAALGSFYLTLNNILLKAVGLGAMVLLTYSLGVGEYGHYLFVLTVPGFLSAFLSVFPSDMATADLARFMGQKEYEKANSYLKEFTIVQLSLGLFLGGIILVPWFISYVSFLGSKELFPYLAALVFLASARNVTNVVLGSWGRFGALAICRSSEGLMRLAAIWAMVYTFHLGVKGALLADLASQGLAVLAMGSTAWKTVGRLKSDDSVGRFLVLSAVRGHGKWAIFQKIGTSFSANYRIWIIRFILGEQGVALFGLAKRIFSFTKTILPLKAVLAPAFAQNYLDKKKMRLYFVKAVKYKFVTGMLVFIVGFLVASPAIKVLFPKYHPAVVPVFRLFLVLALVKSLNDVQIPLFNALQAQRQAFLSFAWGLFLTIIVMPVFVFVLGVMGAVTEVILTSAINGVVGYWFLVRLEPLLKIYPGEILKFDREDRAFLKNMIHIRKVGEDSGAS